MFQHLKLNETFTGLFSTSDIEYTTELFDSFSTMEERTKVVKGKVKKVMVPILMDLMTSPLMEAMKKSYQWEPLPPWQDKGQCHGKTPLVHARGVPPILHRNYSKADREKAREANGPIDIAFSLTQVAKITVHSSQHGVSGRVMADHILDLESKAIGFISGRKTSPRLAQRGIVLFSRLGNLPFEVR